MVVFALGGEQDLEQGDERRRRALGVTRGRRGRQSAVWYRPGGSDDLQECLADAALGEASGYGAHAGQGVHVGRGGGGNLQQRLVLDQALAGDVDPLRFAFAPGREGPQAAEELPVAAARTQPFPRGFRIGTVERGVGQGGHFLGDPVQPAVFLQSGAEAAIDVAQMGDVGGGIGDLGGGERPGGPVGEPVRLVDGATGQAADQRLVADLVAEAGHHGSDLGVEQRRRDGAEAEDEDLDVLAGGVEHLQHGRIGQQRAERGEVDAAGLGVDHRDLMVPGDLHHAEFGEIGALAHELGIDRDERVGGESVAQLVERFGGGDEFGRGARGS